MVSARSHTERWTKCEQTIKNENTVVLKWGIILIRISASSGEFRIVFHVIVQLYTNDYLFTSIGFFWKQRPWYGCFSSIKTAYRCPFRSFLPRGLAKPHLNEGGAVWLSSWWATFWCIGVIWPFVDRKFSRVLCRTLPFILGCFIFLGPLTFILFYGSFLI